ncbi:histone-lysine N-methyltransferase EZ1 isoform X2 [Magnolia sinica]|uniref:histone-lysine N-methyltransferase EZ1 isoform X2 n=1 Tax=Magnolia sinica TaxID=86752 RepID=UPI0026582175|nr:histone-lysine N-methyltransferase EZ1 isoform X2 [Magnolia sinica]
MVSKGAESSSSKFKKYGGEQVTEVSWTLTSRICQLKKHIQTARFASVKEKLERNGKNLKLHTSQLLVLTPTKTDYGSVEKEGTKNMLSFRIESALCKLGGSDAGPGDKENVIIQEEVLSSIVFANNGGGNSPFQLIKLPNVEKIPPYTTWIFLSKNQRMADDQSVVGRRQIYYDQYGSEALICSDSEEEVPEPGEEKHDFSEGEDQILRKVLQEHGLNQDVLNTLSQFIDATPSEIQERYDALNQKSREKQAKDSEGSGEVGSERNIFLDKSLSAALDSFDNLFCRRCLVFDCRLHGCSQNLVIPDEKQPFSLEVEDNGNPCGEQCYLWGREGVQDMPSNRSETSTKCGRDDGDSNSKDDSIVDTSSDTSCNDVKRAATVSSKDAYMGTTPEIVPGGLGTDTNAQVAPSTENVGKRKVLKHGSMSVGNPEPSDEYFLASVVKKQKTVEASDENKDNMVADKANDDIEVTFVKKPSNSGQRQVEATIGSHVWSPIEKELYLKGIEIFGRNSCLIARNLLSGLKTCVEVANYMLDDRGAAPNRSATSPNSFLEENGKGDQDYMEQEIPKRTRFWRRRGRARKLKYTWKSTGHPSIRKRMADGKQQSCKQYTPCGCQQMCGKQCPCLHNGTCCEKYCGCSKSCKNRFRGCHCAKSQCRSRQCPCFAAGRECDPDVCRNCWVSCGDGSLGEPPAQGDGYQCGNMKLLLKQQQRILLGRSDVAGWGAFIKYVLDAYRKGDKLKFANHSSNPNCYAKVMLVAGDHRVGIFAKEHIEASEELFYDYRYGPDQAPIWARKPEGSKRDDPSVSYGRAQKIA